MLIDRRRALAFAGAAALAACSRHKLTNVSAAAKAMDTHRLDQGFPALAQRAAPGAFALGVMDLQTASAWYWNTDRGFPLAGAAAAPIAAAALAKVDAGSFSLTQPVSYDSLDLSPPPSLLAQDWPNPPDKRVSSIAPPDLFRLSLREDDSTAMDVLMKQVGGPGAVGAFLEQKGVLGVRVDRYQREIAVALEGMPTFRAAWKDLGAFDAERDTVAASVRQAAMDAYILDPRDSATVPSALGFLAMLAAGELVSPASTARLLAWMDGPGSLLAPGLPAGTRIAHATGSAIIDLGFEAATTELAIATFAPGRRYAIAAFLVASTATPAARAGLFADAARLAAAAIG